MINKAKNTVYIDSCDVIVLMNIKTSRIIIHISMYTYKTIIMSSQFEITISMHYITVLTDKNFLFESINQLNLTFYAHFANFDIRSIIIRNDDDKAVHLSRNCRVDRMIEVKFLNVFQMKSKVYDLIIKILKISQHKSSWFKKTIMMFTTIVILINAVLIVSISFSQMILNADLMIFMSDVSDIILS